MRLMIASDLHGSAFYCKQMLDAFQRENTDRLFLLGDILYHGPRNDLPKDYAPKEVIAMLNAVKEKIFCIRGNCEAEVDQMVLDFPVLADYAVIPAGDKLIFATHGHVYNEKNLPPIGKGDILLNGHTHVPKCTDHGEYVYMNPGSTSIPKEGSGHSYMIFDGEKFLWKQLDNGKEYMAYSL